MSTCHYCGREFINTRGTRKYCSKLCCQRAQYPDKEIVEKVCKICGGHFCTADNRKIYCSQKCNNDAQNGKRVTTKFEKRQCPWCKKNFYPKQNRGVGRTYCTVKCRRAAEYDRNKFSKAERSKRDWRRERMDSNWWTALERDKYTCQLCGLQLYPSQWSSKRKIIVHHKDGSGEAKKKNHSLDNLMCLCTPCHRHFHGVHLIVENGEYRVAGKVFDYIDLEQVKVGKYPEK